MPRDGSGVYTLPIGNPVVTLTPIASTWANTTMADIAAQLNNVFTRDGLLGPTGPFKIMDGTVAAPGLAWNSEPGMGWYRSAAGFRRFAVGGAFVEALDSTTAASTSLTLTPRAAGQSQIQLRNDPTNFNQLILAATATGALIAESLAGTATAKPLVINFAGGVTVGAGAPFAAAATNPTLTLSKAASGQVCNLTGATNGLLRWRISPGNVAAESGSNTGSDFEIARYNDAGVSLGNALSINRATGLSTFSNGVVSSAGDISAAVGNFMAPGAGAGLWLTSNFSAGFFKNGANDIQLRFNTSSYLNFTLGSGVLAYALNNNYCFSFAGNLEFQIASSSAIKAAGTTWANPSSRAIKHDIEDYTAGLEELLRTRPRTYRLNDAPDKLCYGIVADEMEPVLPQSIGYDDKGNPLFHSDPVFWAAVNAIKTLHQRIAALENA